MASGVPLNGLVAKCPCLPGWLARLFADCDVSRFPLDDAQSVCTIQRCEGLALTSVRVCDADYLGAMEFQRQTDSSYMAVRKALCEIPEEYPIRFWNFIPDIHKRISDSLSRYMVFNAGRYGAFLDWYGETFSRRIATATGVGHKGRDLVVYCLSSQTPGVAIENPRQISSYCYSARYGPLPPTFARATAWRGGDRAMLLVGGTASIRGEASLHHRNPWHQTQETLENLAAVVKSGWREVSAPECGDCDDLDLWLRNLRCLRVYHVRAADRPAIAGAMASHCPAIHEVEWMQADLCRPELLVEIEGVASLPDVNHQTFHNMGQMKPALLGA